MFYLFLQIGMSFGTMYGILREFCYTSTCHLIIKISIVVKNFSFVVIVLTLTPSVWPKVFGVEEFKSVISFLKFFIHYLNTDFLVRYMQAACLRFCSLIIFLFRYNVLHAMITQDFFVRHVGFMCLTLPYPFSIGLATNAYVPLLVIMSDEQL
jgi:hypothetical protein